MTFSNNAVSADNYNKLRCKHYESMGWIVESNGVEEKLKDNPELLKKIQQINNDPEIQKLRNPPDIKLTHKISKKQIFIETKYGEGRNRWNGRITPSTLEAGQIACNLLLFRSGDNIMYDIWDHEYKISRGLVVNESIVDKLGRWINFHPIQQDLIQWISKIVNKEPSNIGYDNSGGERSNDPFIGIDPNEFFKLRPADDIILDYGLGLSLNDTGVIEE